MMFDGRDMLAMEKEEFEQEMLDMIVDICGDEAAAEERDIDLFEAGLLDSMAAIELLVSIEDRFGVAIAPTELERDAMNTTNKILEQVWERM
jgi:D-alanine--poly(phosphoribitol) ligase subunit 2